MVLLLKRLRDLIKMISKRSITQEYIMEVLKSVIKITNEMGINCYMQGGTMLGAIRHKGFIPWDDDVDLGMMREDYDYFLTSVKQYLPEHLELRTYWDESDHHYYFARIIDNRHVIKRMGSAEIRYENVWVDIFPLDGMPDNTFSRRVQMLRLSWARFMYHLSCIEKVNAKRPGRPLLEKAVIKTALLIRPFILMNTTKALNQLDMLLKKYPASESGWIINFMGQTSFEFTEMFRKEIYGEGKVYSFEDIQMIGPERYDEYLKSLYGDYMTPPKNIDKNAHVAELIK